MKGKEQSKWEKYASDFCFQHGDLRNFRNFKKSLNQEKLFKLLKKCYFAGLIQAMETSLNVNKKYKHETIDEFVGDLHALTKEIYDELNAKYSSNSMKELSLETLATFSCTENIKHLGQVSLKGYK